MSEDNPNTPENAIAIAETYFGYKAYILSRALRDFEANLMEGITDSNKRHWTETGAMLAHSGLLVLNESLAVFLKSLGKNYLSDTVYRDLNNLLNRQIERDDGKLINNNTLLRFRERESTLWHDFYKRRTAQRLLNYSWVDKGGTEKTRKSAIKSDKKNSGDTSDQKIVGTTFIDIDFGKPDLNYAHVPVLVTSNLAQSGLYNYNMWILDSHIVDELKHFGRSNYAFANGDVTQITSPDDLLHTFKRWNFGTKSGLMEYTVTKTPDALPIRLYYDEVYGDKLFRALEGIEWDLPTAESFKSPLCMSGPETRVRADRDRDITSTEDIAKLAQGMAENHARLVRSLAAYDFESCLLHVIWEREKAEYDKKIEDVKKKATRQEVIRDTGDWVLRGLEAIGLLENPPYANFNVEDYMRANYSEFEQYNTWLAERKQDWLNANGFSDESQAFEAYLERNGLLDLRYKDDAETKAEYDRTLIHFRTEVVEKGILERLFYEKGASEEIIDDAIESIVRVALDWFKEWQWEGETMTQEDVLQKLVKDPAVREDIEAKFYAMVEQGKIPERFEYFAKFCEEYGPEKAFNLFMSKVQNVPQKFGSAVNLDKEIATFTSKFREGLQWHGSVKKVILYEDSSNRRIEQVAGEDHALYYESADSTPISGTIWHLSGDEQFKIDLSSQYGPHARDWIFIRDNNNSGIEFNDGKIEIVLSNTLKGRDYKLVHDFKEKLTTSSLGDLIYNFKLTREELKFVRVAVFPKKGKSGEYHFRTGVILEDESNLHYFACRDQDTKDVDLDGDGKAGLSTGVVKYTQDTFPSAYFGQIETKEFEAIFGPEIQLNTGGFYTLGVQSVEDALTLILGGNAVQIGGSSVYGRMPGVELRNALQRAIDRPFTKTASVAMPHMTEAYNLTGGRTSTRGKCRLFSFINTRRSSTGSWFKLLDDNFNAPEYLDIPYGGRDVVPVISQHYDLPHIGIDKGIFYAPKIDENGEVILDPLGRPETTKYYAISVYDIQGQLKNNPNLLEAIGSIGQILWRGDSYSVAIGVPADEVDVYQTVPTMQRVWESGALKDALILGGYLGAFALIGAITPGLPVGAQAVVGAVMGSRFMKSGMPDFFAHYGFELADYALRSARP
ncbi:hypothetical protein JXB41_09175 [Candidatus Woesearchaeota archaeon]|nr:hypothetical protein [Candidatus Woesearchaeota archaeon]